VSYLRAPIPAHDGTSTRVRPARLGATFVQNPFTLFVSREFWPDGPIAPPQYRDQFEKGLSPRFRDIFAKYRQIYDSAIIGDNCSALRHFGECIKEL
jgi:hypothetical protein